MHGTQFHLKQLLTAGQKLTSVVLAIDKLGTNTKQHNRKSMHLFLWNTKVASGLWLRLCLLRVRVKVNIRQLLMISSFLMKTSQTTVILTTWGT